MFYTSTLFEKLSKKIHYESQKPYFKTFSMNILVDNSVEYILMGNKSDVSMLICDRYVTTSDISCGG